MRRWLRRRRQQRVPWKSKPISSRAWWPHSSCSPSPSDPSSPRARDTTCSPRHWHRHTRETGYPRTCPTHQKPWTPAIAGVTSNRASSASEGATQARRGSNAGPPYHLDSSYPRKRVSTYLPRQQRAMDSRHRGSDEQLGVFYPHGNDAGPPCHWDSSYLRMRVSTYLPCPPRAMDSRLRGSDEQEWRHPPARELGCNAV